MVGQSLKRDNLYPAYERGKRENAKILRLTESGTKLFEAKLEKVSEELLETQRVRTKNKQITKRKAIIEDILSVFLKKCAIVY